MTDTLHQLIDRLRQTCGMSESGRLADGELLQRFVRSRDEAVFEVLVWRHGGMVLASAHRLWATTPMPATWRRLGVVGRMRYRRITISVDS